jgi:peptidase A4-like protein
LSGTLTGNARRWLRAWHAWYEVYPGAAVNFPDPVSPGDQFSGSVTYTSPSTFSLVLTDTTKDWTQTQRVTLASAARSSAEVIAEAPCCTSNGGILPLTGFGTASFASAAANGQSLATFHPTEIVMPDTSVSAISSSGGVHGQLHRLPRVPLVRTRPSGG